MIFNNHERFRGKHAFLSPSQCSWLNYSDEKLMQRIEAQEAIERGTALHEYAEQAIKLGIHQLEKNPEFPSVSQFINDAIDMHMTPEVPLVWSDNFYGTADAISFGREKRKDILRIHDLKTGETPAKFEQLRTYAALFCLEYGYTPGEIKTELCIYQFGKIKKECPTAEDILPIMDKIQRFDDILDQRKHTGG